MINNTFLQISNFSGLQKHEKFELECVQDQVSVETAMKPLNGFALNFNTIMVAIGLVATYTIVLLQFKIDEIKWCTVLYRMDAPQLLGPVTVFSILVSSISFQITDVQKYSTYCLPVLQLFCVYVKQECREYALSICLCVFLAFFNAPGPDR